MGRPRAGPAGPIRPGGASAPAVDGSHATWDVANSSARSEVYREIWSALRARPPDERDRLAMSVLAWAGLPAAARPSHRTLTTAELGGLAATGSSRSAAHTADHPWLAGLSPAEQADEIAGRPGRARGPPRAPVDSFAYPHGGPDDIGAAAHAVRAAGLGTAFLATPGWSVPRTDRYALPRLFVEDMDGEGFGRLLWRYAGIRVGLTMTEAAPLVSVVTIFHNAPVGFFEEAIASVRGPDRAAAGSCCSSTTARPTRAPSSLDARPRPIPSGSAC